MGSHFAVPDVRKGHHPIVIPERDSAFDDEEEEEYNSIQVGVADAIEGGHGKHPQVISRQVGSGTVPKIRK